MDENCLICTKSFTVVNNKVKNHNALSLGSKNLFSTAASTKSVAKIWFQPGKYAG